MFAGAVAAGMIAAAFVELSVGIGRSRNQPQVESEAILVALRAVPEGCLLSPWDVVLREWPKTLVPQGALRQNDPFEGHVATASLRPGQPLLSTHLKAVKTATSTAQLRLPNSMNRDDAGPKPPDAPVATNPSPSDSRRDVTSVFVDGRTIDIHPVISEDREDRLEPECIAIPPKVAKQLRKPPSAVPPMPATRMAEAPSKSQSKSPSRSPAPRVSSRPPAAQYVGAKTTMSPQREPSSEDRAQGPKTVFSKLNAGFEAFEAEVNRFRREKLGTLWRSDSAVR